MGIVTRGAEQFTAALQKTLRHSQPVNGTYDLKAVLRGRTLIEEQHKIGKRLASRIGEWFAVVFADRMGKREARGFQMALHTHLHLANGIETRGIDDGFANSL